MFTIWDADNWMNRGINEKDETKKVMAYMVARKIIKDLREQGTVDRYTLDWYSNKLDGIERRGY